MNIYISVKRNTEGKKEEEEEEETLYQKTHTVENNRTEGLGTGRKQCSSLEYPPRNKGAKNLSYKQTVRELSAAATRPRKL